MPETSDSAGVPVVEVDLDTADDVAAPNALGQISLLVRAHQVPVGIVTQLPVEGGEQARRAAVWDAMADGVAAHLRDDGYGGEVSPEAVRATQASCTYAARDVDQLVSVVVCTLGQDPRLRLTVESVLNQSHSHLELVVVDNDPASNRVATLLANVDDTRLRVIEESRRGLSRARNAGLLAARGDIVAFTDDDAIADRHWVSQIIAPFGQDARVKCTTGLVLPAELANSSQLLFEQYGAFDKGFQRTVWQVNPDPHTVAPGVDGERDTLFPFSPGIFGSGNNMAYARRWIIEHGSFDPVLGAGSSTRSGEDVDAFLTVLLHHQLLVYVPQAVIRHFARSDVPGLRKQVYGYGIGMAATITKHLLSDPRKARQILARLPAGLRKLLDPGSSKNAAKDRSYPRSLTVLEIIGYGIGPALYLRARLRQRLERTAT